MASMNAGSKVGSVDEQAYERTDGRAIEDEDEFAVVEEHRTDHGATPTSSPDEETSAEQTGSPLSATRHDRGLSTEIGWHRDA